MIPGFVVAQAQDTEETVEKQDYYVVVEENAPESPAVSTTATKLPELLQWTPASVGVVTSSLFNLQDAIVLGDALRNVSGINSQTGFGVFDFFTIRGFDSLSSSLVLTDGAPEPEVTFYQLYNVDRVEVLKGPGAFLYGGNPLSGTVNLIRKQPLFDDFVRIGTSYGQFGTYMGALDWNTGCPTAAFRLNGLWQASDRYRDDKDKHDVAVNPAFTWRISDDSDLRINFEYQHNRYHPDSGIPVEGDHLLDVSRTTSYQSPFDTSEQDLYRTRVDYETKISDSITLRDKFYNTRLDWLSKGTLINGAFSGLVFRTLPVLDDSQNVWGNQVEAVINLQTGGIKHKLLAGFELTRFKDDFTLDVALLPPIAANNPVETADEPLFFIPGQSRAGDARSIVAAPYFADQMILTDQVRLLVGGRFDMLNYDETITSTSRNENKFSPMAGVVYAPVSNLSLYFNAGQAFAPPSTLVVGQRKPEESTQYEAGVKHDFQKGKLVTTVAVYHIEKQNIAIPDATGVTRQNGDQNSNGVELEVRGNPDPHWNLAFAYAFNDSELTKFTELVFTGQGSVSVDRSGNTPAFAPQHILNLWATRTFKNGFGIGGGPRYVGDQFISEDNVFKIDSYLTFDAAVFYDIDRWRFSLNFKNLTDREYETRGFGSTSAIPADPFAVYAGVDFRL